MDHPLRDEKLYVILPFLKHCLCMKCKKEDDIDLEEAPASMLKRMSVKCHLEKDLSLFGKYQDALESIEVNQIEMKDLCDTLDDVYDEEIKFQERSLKKRASKFIARTSMM